MSDPGMTMEAQIEIIWQMGLASLSSNNNELVLPQRMATHLPPANVEDLKLRLSRHIGAPTTSFVDQESQVFRICRVPSRLQTGDSPASLSSPAPSTTSRSPANPAPKANRSGKASSRGGKSLIPRPPNAFILFRKDRHPGLKKNNRTLHNNDISIILGKEWQNASEEVKAAYKARAERIKQQHAFDNPSYHYAPRKSGDKKRRVTKKKLIHMRSASSATDIADMDPEGAAAVSPSDLDSADEVSKSRSASLLKTAENWIGARRSPYVSRPTFNDMANLEITLPSNNANLFREVQDYQNLRGSYSTVPFNSGSAAQVVTSLPQYSQNDDAFLNSLIDWQGIANDASMLKEATPEELALADLELGNSYLDFSAEQTRTAFEEEIARTIAGV